MDPTLSEYTDQERTLSKRDIFYTSSDGLHLYAADYGPADADLTVLCMHGLTRNHKDFESMIKALNLPYRFVAVDVRGRGKSEYDSTGESYLPQKYAEDMAVLIDQLQPRSLALIGTSMGGLMAMLISHVMPDKISGIILNDIGPEVGFEGLKRIASYVGAGEEFSSWQAAADSIRAVQGNLFPDFKDADWMDMARRTCIETEDGNIKFDYDPAISRNLSIEPPNWRMRFLSWRLFGKMKSIPLLIVRGAHSDILSEKIARRMHRRHKGSEVVTVPNRGHTPFLDEPSALSAITKFLQNLESSS